MDPALALEAVLTLLDGAQLAEADQALDSILQQLTSALPEAWRKQVAAVDATGCAGRLIPLLEQRAAVQPGHPGLNRWLEALRPLLPAAAIDRLFRIAPGRYIAYGWQASAGRPELVIRSSSGAWRVVAGDGPPLRRPDVAAHLGMPTLEDCGFVQRLDLPEGFLPQRIWLNGLATEPGLVDLQGLPYLELMDALLLHCQPTTTPIERLPGLLQCALGTCLLDARQLLREPSQWQGLIQERRWYGSPSGDGEAEITVVVPLYRRWDFVLGQVAGFAVDPWFLSGRAELLYVVDDPSIATEFLGWCEGHLPHEPLSITVLNLHRNSGFAMACNTGVQATCTPLVCLLNSDVLPIEPGWLDPLVQELRAQPDALLAPLLLYDTGLVQHAGMEVATRNDGSGLPKCIHPLKGLHRDQLETLHHDQGPYRCEALSGAALAMERDQFLSVGGFDPAFGRGDFEDLELSLRWRRRGADLWMVHQAALTHLERQSISREPDRLAQWRQVVNSWLAQTLCPELAGVGAGAAV